MNKNFKVLLLGETGAGKTSLINKICLPEHVTCLYDCNVEFGYKNEPLNDTEASIQFLTMIESNAEGVLRLKHHIRSFFRDTNIVIIVIDLSHPSFLENFSKWIFEIEKYYKMFQKNFKILCLGTKADVKPKQYFLNYSENLGLEISKLSNKVKQNVFFYEVSSKDDDSCNKLLNQIKLLLESIINANLQELDKKNILQPNYPIGGLRYKL
jgi:GTPase SAR1 family protein